MAWALRLPCVSATSRGQGDGQNVRRSAYAGLHIILCMEVVLLGIVFALRGQVGGWFTDNAEVSGMVAALFFPFLIYQFGDGLQINFANALRGISDVKPMMIIAFISYFYYIFARRVPLRFRFRLGG